MLSFILRLQREFEREHGYSPNMLYLNHDQYQRLKFELGDALRPSVGQRLGLEIVLSGDCIHPHVGWSSVALRKVAHG